MTNIGIFAIAALLFAAVGAGVIRAQATPDASTEQEVATATDGGASDQATAPTDTTHQSATQPTTENPSGDTGSTTADSPAPSAEPAPSDQPSPSPAGDTSDGGGGDQPSPSPSPAPSPSPSPSPTAQTWENHDTLTANGADPADGTALQPGAIATYQFVYSVTTPRTGTTLHAELRPVAGDASGWQVRLSSLDGAGNDWSAASLTAEATESATTQPGTTFALTVTFHAPATVTAPSSVALYLSSTATTPAGTTETGLAGDAALAQPQVVPPPSPSPTPSPSPSPSPHPATSLRVFAASPNPSPSPSPSPSPVAGLPTVSMSNVNFGTITWDPSSASYPAPSPTTATITLTSTTGSGNTPQWQVSLSGTDLRNTNDPSQAIPIGAVTYQGIPSPPSSVTPAGISAGTALSASAQEIATGKGIGGNGTQVPFNVSLKITPPSTLPSGTYNGTITVTIAAAGP